MALAAITRCIPDSFRQALTQTPGPAIDVQRAREQHRAYQAALIQCGARLAQISAEEAYPDCCFVEDQAILFDELAIMCRPGHPSRRGEAAPVRSVLRHWGLDIVDLPPGPTLDGGDVLRVGHTVFVGQSGRTDPRAAPALQQILRDRARVVQIPVQGDLHLKCSCTSPAPGVVLMAEGHLDPRPFQEVAQVILTPAEEAYAANVVGIGGRVLVAAGFPVTRAKLEALGLRPIVLELDAIAAADGSLTCLSILHRSTGVRKR